MRGRAYRRHQRERAVRYTFHVYFYIWGDWKGWQRYNRFYDDLVIGANKWALQDENRAETIVLAKKVADNLANCSCYLYRDWGSETPQKLRSRMALVDDREGLWDNLGV